MEEKKNCIVCHNEIFKEATKCTHCNSFQNWRRYLDFSKTFLALLIALFSVLGIVIPVLKDAMEKDFSQLEVKEYVILNDGISIITHNKGTKPGYISNSKIIVCNTTTDNELFSYNLNLRSPSISRLVKDRTVDKKFYQLNNCHFIRKTFELSKKINEGLNSENFIFFVQLEITQFDGNKKVVPIEPSQVKDLFWNIDRGNCGDINTLIDIENNNK